MNVRRFLQRYKTMFAYGISLAILLLLLRWLELRFVILNNAMEIYVGLIALVFTILGIWLAIKLMRPKMVIIEKDVIIEKKVFVSNADFVLNKAELDRLGISRRELEVLELMAEGLSNQEIAARLFVSLNTVKTHTSNLFEKLDVKRRGQAAEKAKKLGLLPV